MHEQQNEREQPKVSNDLELWCLVVGVIGTAFPVIMKKTDRVWELQKAIRNGAVEIFKDFNAAQLQVFLAQKDTGEWLTATEIQAIEKGDSKPANALLDRGHLGSMNRLADIFQNLDTTVVHVLVRAPLATIATQMEADIVGKRKQSMEAIGEVETMAILMKELTLLFNALEEKKATQQQPVPSLRLNDFFKGFGGFPPSYFVRREERMLWKLVTQVMSKKNKRVVIVGSAGVGKSCFLMLLSLFLACAKKQQILVIRRLKKFSETNAVIWLDGENETCIRKANLSAAKIASLPDKKIFRDALLICDGYSRKEIDHHFGHYHLLSTSMIDKCNFDDSTCELLLPAWRYTDLLEYTQANFSAWIKSTGLDPEKHKDMADMAKEQYSYSGGSLCDFCSNRKNMKNRLDEICGIVQSMQNIDLEDIASHRSGLLARIRRYYVVDPTNQAHYSSVGYWKAQLDSEYAFKRIGRFMDWDKHLDHHQFGQQISAGCWGSAFEHCFHGSVHRSTRETPVELVNVVVNSNPSYSNQRYDRIMISGPSVDRKGVMEKECYECLGKLTPRTYWHPDGVDIPLIEAVVVCEAVLRGSSLKETITAIISTTVTNTKVFKPKVWENLNRILDNNKNIPKTIPRAFVVVGPDASTCKSFILIDAPASNDFMVCCFDPLKFSRELY